MDQKEITPGLFYNMFFVLHGMRMEVILVLKTGLTLHYTALHYITLPYITCTFHIHFIDQPINPVTLDVKPVMFHTL